MKAICPISGIPFRTYDSLPLSWAVEHPIFSIPFEQLVLLLDTIKNQEEEQLTNWNREIIDQKKAVKEAASIKDLTNQVNLAIHEHNWKNPCFRLFQTKHLVLLAFMHHAELLIVEKGYAARPKPEVIDSHFWNGSEAFIWCCTISNPKLRQRLPKYKVSRYNEEMENLPEFIEEITKIKDNIGSRYRDYSTEKRLAAWEQAIAILSRRRNTLKQKLSTSHNTLAAKWALTITQAPRDIWNFWYAILSSSSTRICFDGISVDGRIESVTPGDLRELYDWLDDNLVRPKGSLDEYHRDDSEFYFIARQTVLDIVRTHLSILEQGLSSYKIVNAALGDKILSASDDSLEKKALEKGLTGKPMFNQFPNKMAFIKAMAKWRTETKNTLLQAIESTEEKKGKDAKYEIL